jgi:hypothetical protein
MQRRTQPRAPLYFRAFVILTPNEVKRKDLLFIQDWAKQILRCALRMTI